ncbi:MAG: chromate transporter [Clostridia bacterium]|nr:chromate transporter [Clostridia bacterium]
MILLELLVGFLKIGLFSFGGAYGAIPLIREVVLSYGWIEEEKLSYMIAVSESTPGPIMVNMATYIGSTKVGILGALIATVAVVLPAFITVIILTLILKNLIKNGAVQSMLNSLKSCVAGIILATGVYMLLINCIGSVKNVSVNIAAVVMTAALGAVYLGSRKIIKGGISPIVLICLAGSAGIFVYGW